MSIYDAFVTFMCVIVIAESGAIVWLFLRYDALMRSLIRESNPDVVFPEDRTEMLKKLEEDRALREEKQRVDDYLLVLKSGEATDDDVRKFGINEDL